MLRKLVVLFICFLLFTTCSNADECINLGSDGYDQLWYLCTLSDGRLIFYGSKAEVGNYLTSSPFLLCLNSDLSISWTYEDYSKQGYIYSCGSLLQEDKIGMIYSSNLSTDSTTTGVIIFTPDGKIACDQILSNSDPSYQCSNCLCFPTISYNGAFVYAFYDWDGNHLFEIRRKKDILIQQVLAFENDIIIAGEEYLSNGRAKIMKVDHSGNLLWETVLPLHASFSSLSIIDKCIQTNDNGLLVRIIESNTERSISIGCLVLLDSDGQIIWHNICKGNNKSENYCQDLYEYNNTYMVLERRGLNSTLDTPSIIHWYNIEGEEMGSRKISVKSADDLSNQFSDSTLLIGGQFLETSDGLWVLYNVMEERDDVFQEMDTADPVIFRVSEI